MMLTRDICRTITKFRMKLHDVRFKPEKARRAAKKIKNREALDTYIRKWYAALTHDRVEFSQYEMPSWKMRTKDKWVRAHKNRARKAAEQAQILLVSLTCQWRFQNRIWVRGGSRAFARISSRTLGRYVAVTNPAPPRYRSNGFQRISVALQTTPEEPRQ